MAALNAQQNSQQRNLTIHQAAIASQQAAMIKQKAAMASHQADMTSQKAAMAIQQAGNQIKVEHQANTSRQVQFQSSQGTQYQLNFVPNSSGDKQYYMSSPEGHNSGQPSVSPDHQNQILSPNTQNTTDHNFNNGTTSTLNRQLFQAQQLNYSPPQNWMTIQGQHQQQQAAAWNISTQQQLERTSPQQQLERTSPQQQLERTSPQQQPERSSPQQKLEHTSPQQQLQHTSPQQQLQHSPTTLKTEHEKRQLRFKFYNEHLHALMYREKQEQIRHYQELQTQLSMRLAQTQRQVFVNQYHQREGQHQLKIRQIHKLILKLQIFEEVRQRVLQQQQSSPAEFKHNPLQQQQFHPQQQQHLVQQQISPQQKQHLVQQQISPQQQQQHLVQQQISPQQQFELLLQQHNARYRPNQVQLQQHSPQNQLSPPQFEVNAQQPNNLKQSSLLQMKKELSPPPSEKKTEKPTSKNQQISPKQELIQQPNSDMPLLATESEHINNDDQNVNKKLMNENNHVLSSSVDYDESPPHQLPEVKDFFDFDMNQINNTYNVSPANVKKEQLIVTSNIHEQLNLEQLLNNSDLNSPKLLSNSGRSKQNFSMENQGSSNDFQVNQFPDIFQYDWQDQVQGNQEEQKSAKVEQNQDLWDELFNIIN